MTKWPPLFCLTAIFLASTLCSAQETRETKADATADSKVRVQPTLTEAKAEFSAADAELNQVYGKAKQVLAEWKFEQLKSEQKEWLEYRDARAMSDAVFNGGQKFYQREKEAPDYWESLTWNSETRSGMITGWIEADEKYDGEVPWTGAWQDGHGGWLRIVQLEIPAAAQEKKDGLAEPIGKMHFQLEVVRGPTYHSGAIGGEARVNGGMAFFTDSDNVEPRPFDDGSEAWLIFEKNYGVPQLEIRAANAMGYHGARAYFRGTYTWVSDLSAEERKAVIEGDRAGHE